MSMGNKGMSKLKYTFFPSLKIFQLKNQAQPSVRYDLTTLIFIQS